MASVLSFGLVWPNPQALGLLIAFTAWVALGRDQPDWRRAGQVDRNTFWLAAVSVPLTSAALAWFTTSGRTDLDTATEGLTGLPMWAILLAGIGFFLANPTVEEILFRGALQTALTRTFGNVAIAIAVQGIGSIHLPWLVHVLANATMFTVIAAMAINEGTL